MLSLCELELGSFHLKYRQLGASDLRVPVISLGSWLTYSGGVEKRQAFACIHTALDLGINFIDTANVYGRGAAESVLGEALHGIARNTLLVARGARLRQVTAALGEACALQEIEALTRPARQEQPQPAAFLSERWGGRWASFFAGNAASAWSI